MGEWEEHGDRRYSYLLVPSNGHRWLVLWPMYHAVLGMGGVSLASVGLQVFSGIGVLSLCSRCTTLFEGF